MLVSEGGVSAVTNAVGEGTLLGAVSVTCGSFPSINSTVASTSRIAFSSDSIAAVAGNGVSLNVFSRSLTSGFAEQALANQVIVNNNKALR